MLDKMNAYSNKTIRQLKPRYRYLCQRKHLVDWLSGVGDSLNISNGAIHNAVLLLDLYASRETQDFDCELASLAALLVSAKFLQMKYPSADSLNSATDNRYNYDKIVGMEGYFLSVIDWELMQYTVYDFLNFFLAQGCFFPSDKILLNSPGSNGQGGERSQRVTRDLIVSVRKFAEFFTDFSV